MDTTKKDFYEQIFSPTNEEDKTGLNKDNIKAKAFDKIAEQYYFGNFGSISKIDLETLLFSIYIERILERNEPEFNEESDYKLSKELGITQSKISNLKVRKQLKYPYEKFDWKQSFKRILKNAKIEDNKIVIFIPDVNLYIELKNAIESQGGLVDATLNSKVLKVSYVDFLDLVTIVGDDVGESRKLLLKALNEELKQSQLVNNSLNDDKPFGQQLKDIGINFTRNLFSSVFDRIPVVGGAASTAFGEIFDIVKEKFVKNKIIHCYS